MLYRSFRFRATAGRLSRQARRFLVAEATTLALNWSTFQLLLDQVPGVPPELLSFLGTFLVLVAFAYPVRRWLVFVVPEREPAAAKSTSGRPT